MLLISLGPGRSIQRFTQGSLVSPSLNPLPSDPPFLSWPLKPPLSPSGPIHRPQGQVVKFRSSNRFWLLVGNSASDALTTAAIRRPSLFAGGPRRREALKITTMKYVEHSADQNCTRML